MASLSRWLIGTFVVVVGLLVVSACAPAAAPSPTATPAKPAATQPPAAPKASPSTAAAPKPAATTAPAATASAPAATKPAASADWKAEWDKVLAAAKKEGKVVVAGGAGAGYRKAVDAFQKAYPDIKLEFTGGSGGNVHAPKIMAERQGGQYLWDVYQGAGSVMVDPLIPQKLLAPLRPALILPEVLDDSKWLGGFDAGWIDMGHKFGYSPMPYRSYTAQVNRNLAPESELKTFEDLLNPKWKGKIAWLDPRNPGSGQSSGRVFYYIKGEDWLRQLMSQDLQLYQDARALLEGLVRGAYPVAIGTREDEILNFTNEGLMDGIEYLDPNSNMGGYVTGGSSSIAIIDKAPHPNAAAVFVNWYLTKAAAEVYVKEAGVASLRTDVESPPEVKPHLGDVNVHGEAFLSKVIPAANNLFKAALK